MRWLRTKEFIGICAGAIGLAISLFARAEIKLANGSYSISSASIAPEWADLLAKASIASIFLSINGNVKVKDLFTTLWSLTPKSESKGTENHENGKEGEDGEKISAPVKYHSGEDPTHILYCLSSKEYCHLFREDSRKGIRENCKISCRDFSEQTRKNPFYANIYRLALNSDRLPPTHCFSVAWQDFKGKKVFLCWVANFNLLGIDPGRFAKNIFEKWNGHCSGFYVRGASRSEINSRIPWEESLAKIIAQNLRSDFLSQKCNLRRIK